MIEVEALTQRYGSYTAVQELGFRLEPGEVVGFLGPNGAGKTTTLKVLATFLAPSAGRAVVAGHDVATAPEAVRRALGYLPEHCPLYDEMEVEGFLGFVATVRGLDAGERRAALARVVAACRLEEVLGRPIADLSKGYRQRVGIAQALLHDPPVLILDEPTSGLDPNQVLEVRDLVRELGAERTVLFSSHILAEVEATCRRVLVIRQGRLVADDALDALKARVTGGAVRVRFHPDPPLAPELVERLAAEPGVARVVPAAAGLAGLERDGEPTESADGCYLVRPAPGTGDLAPRLFRFARDEGLVLAELAPLNVALEDVFLSLAGAASGGRP